jgi:hypothetical protein
MERNAVSPASGQATVIERKGKASDEATVMERFGTGGADATLLEAKTAWSPGSEATVIEQKYQPGERKKNRRLIGIAAGVGVVLLATGGFFLFKPSATSTPAAATASAPAAGAVVSASNGTASAPGSGAGGQGLLLLSANPYGEIQKITDGNGREVALRDEDRSTPARIELAPGKYQVTMVGPPDSGKSQTFPVEIHPGLATPVKMNPKLGEVDYEKLQQELAQQ